MVQISAEEPNRILSTLNLTATLTPIWVRGKKVSQARGSGNSVTAQITGEKPPRTAASGPVKLPKIASLQRSEL